MPASDRVGPDDGYGVEDSDGRDRLGFKDTSIMPKGTIGAAKDQLTNAKDSANQLDAAAASRGNVVGVQDKEGATAKQTAVEALDGLRSAEWSSV
jgi:hypothetical protein